MNQKKSKWEGLRAIVVARQSQDKKGTGSNAAQVDYMQQEFDRVGLVYVDKLTLDGVAASAPAKLEDFLQQLFDRKRTKNDFDVIAWQVEDRASRSGGEHGMWLQHEAKRHGLRVFFAGDDQPNVPYQSVLKVAKYESAMDTSVCTGRRSAQGQTWAIKDGFFRTAGQTPIGCDRIYYGTDNKPRFTIHNLPNGLQEQRDPVTGQVIGNYGTIGKKSYNRFRKQRNEYSLLLPGDRDQRKVVRVIFYLRYKKGWRGCRIADYLNCNAIPSPKGKEWSQRQVQIIYENPAYTGVTFNNKTFSGRFFRRDRQFGFVALERDEIELVLKKTFSPKLRPMDEWNRIDQPNMYDFLPRDLRDIAIAAQAKLSEERNDPNRAIKPAPVHRASDFLLSGKLRALQDKDNGTLIGTMSGTKDHKISYYRHRRSKRGRRKGSLFNNLIPAKPLHDAVINLLADILQDTPELRERLRQEVEAQRTAAHSDHQDIHGLETERDELQQQLRMVLATLKGSALKAAEPELRRIGDRINILTEQIAAVTAPQQEDRPIDTVVEEAIQVISQERHRLLTLPSAVVRDVIGRLVIDAVVDMETKNVELTIALPVRAPKAPPKNFKNGTFASENVTSALCPAVSSRSPIGGWTQCIITVVSCQYEWKRGSTTVPPCYLCRRKAA